MAAFPGMLEHDRKQAGWSVLRAAWRLPRAASSDPSPVISGLLRMIRPRSAVLDGTPYGTTLGWQHVTDGSLPPRRSTYVGRGRWPSPKGST